MRLTAYFSDSLTGMPLETVSGPYFYCMKKVGATKADFILYNTGTQVVRHLDFVVVQDVLGNVLATAKG